METLNGLKVSGGWVAAGWGRGGQWVMAIPPLPGRMAYISHESQIEEEISQAPEALKAYVRAEVLKNRELAKNEVRHGGRVYELRWHNGQQECRIVGCPDMVAKWGAAYDLGPDADAWFARNRPLAGNEVEQCGEVLALRWHNGRPECIHIRYTDGRREPYESVWGEMDQIEPDALAWFRKHCPSDRFVTENWEVLEFRMRDDGEAEVRDEKYAATDPDYGPGQVTAGSPVRVALYRFRDQERAKWTFKFVNWPLMVVVTGPDNRWHYSGSWGLDRPPTWACNKAEALYREKNPEWRVAVEWNRPGHKGEVTVPVEHNGNTAGYYGRNGAVFYPQGKPWPTHILTQARAKFRENYELKRDEIWFQGMPVTMEAHEDHDVFFRDESGNRVWWNEHWDSRRGDWQRLTWRFTDESERLEAYDRMRNFYYEEHPARGVDPDGNVVRFEIADACGEAVYIDHPTARVATRTNIELNCCPEVDEKWAQLDEKLRAWTKSQLAKKPVVFEGKVTAYEHNNDLQVTRNWGGDITGHAHGPGKFTEFEMEPGVTVRVRGGTRLPVDADMGLRLTIEPMGDA